MCSKILRDQNGALYVFRRYDVRKGNKPPAGSVPAGTNEEGQVEFYWIEVTDSDDPMDQYYQSALKKEGGKLVAVYLICPTPEGFTSREVPSSEIEPGTYELIGPKIQGNRYQLPTETTDVVLSQKGKIITRPVPRHYFIRHGAFSVDTGFFPEINLAGLTKFIVENELEGLVVHFENGKSFKVNRGHIGVELGEEKLNITV